MTVIYLIPGCFLDPIGIMLITLPILLPMWKAVGLDLIWMGRAGGDAAGDRTADAAGRAQMPLSSRPWSATVCH
ncbi:TRAP transporter large permease subunit [Bradyrhizobium sp. RDT10]